MASLTRRSAFSLGAAVCSSLTATLGAASTDDAWAVFREQVATACLALVEDGAKAVLEVNPFGSDRFGLALISVTSDAGTDRLGCIFDKASGVAELTAPFQPTP